ncbi:cellulose binding domain-containing protein [Actinoplanes sp. N902-109]|uniref:cellulose binding domain-containing protein n=1 Tax=Actinoplanes sp. (strain N902-109) TaxID=649831 RepID=UPI00032966D3|nr:cellulose binding domain-containing protein [Actinoplanes sp. N902-109]AGL16796.1 cellulose-binding family protein [Actinoplanes sp. N902-109]
MRKPMRLLVAALTLVAATVVSAGVAAAESNGGVRVMPLGDSITDGYNVPGGYRIGLWQKLVAGGYTVDFVGSGSNGPAALGDHDHEGHSGWTIAQIDANITGWLQRYTPRTILLHIGTNDMYGDAAGAATRLATLVDHITTQAPNTELFVSTIIPRTCCDATVRSYNAQIPGIVSSRANAGKHVHLVSMYNALTTADLADGTHPNAGGYNKMATVWYSALRSVPGSIGTDTPPTSPSATPPTSPSATPPTVPAGACTAGYRLTGSWGGGFQAEVTVQAGAAAVNGWTVRLTLAGGQSITSLWNGVNTGSTGAVSVRNADYNGSVPAGGTTTFGFVANGDGSAAPTGVTCTSP